VLNHGTEAGTHGVLTGYSQGTHGVLSGHSTGLLNAVLKWARRGYSEGIGGKKGDARGTHRVLKGTHRVLKGTQGYSRVLTGYSVGRGVSPCSPGADVGMG
jgi:hypothetical protein